MPIKLFVTDIDGTMTDGGVYYTKDGEHIMKFNRRDGMGIEQLQNAGIKTMAITSERSDIICKRMQKIEIECHVMLGKDDTKIEQLKYWLEKLGINLSEVAYIGDDVNDLECLQHVERAACPADAHPLILELVECRKRTLHGYRCEAKGGEGAVREFADYVIAHYQGRTEKEVVSHTIIRNGWKKETANVAINSGDEE